MLPLISSLATEFAALPDDSPGGLPVSGESAGKFAGLLNRSLTGKQPADPGLPAGNALPPNGKTLPLTLEGVAYSLLEIESPAAGLAEAGLTPFGPTRAESALPGPGLQSGPIVAAIAGELAALQQAQPIASQVAINDLKNPATGQVVELSPLQIAQLIDPVAPVAVLPPGAISEQRLFARSGSVTGPIADAVAGHKALGLSNPADQRLVSTEQLFRGVVPEQRFAPPEGLVEQPGLTAIALKDNSAVASYASKMAAALFDGTSARLTGGPVDGTATTSSSSLPGNVAFASAAPLTAPSASLAGTPTLHIGTPLQDPAWSNELGSRVLVMSGLKLQSARIQLSPAELGPITVNLVVNDEGADLTFHAHHVLTRDAIEQALPKLREMLGENGLTLGNATVSTRDGQKDGFEHASRQAGDTDSDRADATGGEASGEIRPVRILKGLLDTFV
jgi:flagellar hook-length control protein FliK